MTWDYRVIKYNTNGNVYYKIHEVYYNEKGEIELYTEEPIEPHGDTLEELIKDIEFMAEATKKPVISKKELDEKITKNKGAVRNTDSSDLKTNEHNISDRSDYIFD